MLRKWNRCALAAGLALSAGLVAPVAEADTVTIKNTSNEIRTLSDIYAFSEPLNKGTRTMIKARGDASDDVHIAPGGTKNYDAPRGTDSLTISWMLDGKEVEDDVPDGSDVDIELAMFSSPGFDGDMGVAFDDAPGLMPQQGFVGLVAGGTLVGFPEYAWFSFYDTSDSGGFIERDDLGIPTSPLFSGVVEVGGTFVVSPAPASMALLGLGGLVAAGRRRR